MRTTRQMMQRTGLMTPLQRTGLMTKWLQTSEERQQTAVFFRNAMGVGSDRTIA